MKKSYLLSLIKPQVACAVVSFLIMPSAFAVSINCSGLLKITSDGGWVTASPADLSLSSTAGGQMAGVLALNADKIPVMLDVSGGTVSGSFTSDVSYKVVASTHYLNIMSGLYIEMTGAVQSQGVKGINDNSRFDGILACTYGQ